jgi:hypothetical protein
VIRCAKCKAFTSNNVALRGFDDIKSATGDCWRHGRGVEVIWEAWEDWGWSEEDERRHEDKLIALIEDGS